MDRVSRGGARALARVFLCWCSLWLCAFGGCALLLCVRSASAGAFTGYGSLGAFGSSLSFGEVKGVAVDAEGDVYVYEAGEGGSIHKFDAAGNPVDFSGLAGNVIAGVGVGGNGESEIAVSQAGLTKGDIYVAFFGSPTVSIYEPSGLKSAGELSEMLGAPWESPCG